MIKLSKIKKLIEKYLPEIEYADLADYAAKEMGIALHPKIHLTWLTEEQGNQIKEHFLGEEHPEPDFGEHIYIAAGRRSRTIVIPKYPDKIADYPPVPLGHVGYADYMKYGAVARIKANQFGNIDLGHWVKSLASEPEYSLQYYADYIINIFQAMKIITYEEFMQPIIVDTGEKTRSILAEQRALMAKKESPVDLPRGVDARPKISVRNLPEDRGEIFGNVV